MKDKDKLKHENMVQKPAQSPEQQLDQELAQEFEQQPDQKLAKEPKNAIEGATEIATREPNIIFLRANEKLSAAGYQLLVDRTEALNQAWQGEIKFVLIPYSVDVVE